MNKIVQVINGFKTFLSEVKMELVKCSWPTWTELYESTIVVAVSVALMGVFVGVCDIMLMNLLKLVAQ